MGRKKCGRQSEELSEACTFVDIGAIRKTIVVRSVTTIFLETSS